MVGEILIAVGHHECNHQHFTIEVDDKHDVMYDVGNGILLDVCEFQNYPEMHAHWRDLWSVHR